MKILITGICGFVGSILAQELKKQGLTIYGIDNLSRDGSYNNVCKLKNEEIKVQYGNLACHSIVENIPKINWIIHAAADPRVLAGLDNSQQLIENNLLATINLLEYCKKNKTGFIFISTSRVYSVVSLNNIQYQIKNNIFEPRFPQEIRGLTTNGINEDFSTSPPLSLYGSSKLTSEILALEYGDLFGFPVWINRCSMMAGGRQFGEFNQGVLTYWINSWKNNKKLQYIGYSGFQTRDCFHPKDLVPVLTKQIKNKNLNKSIPQICNFGGGNQNIISLLQLSEWCEKQFGVRKIGNIKTKRKFDVPWIVFDCSLAKKIWNWSITPINQILEEIAFKKNEI